MTQNKRNILALCIISLTAGFSRLYAESIPRIQSETAIVVDNSSGLVIAGKYIDKRVKPASLTKLMTEYILLDQVQKGSIKWEDNVSVGDYPARISSSPRLSDFRVREGEIYTVKELFYAMAVFSANSAAISLSEHVAGSESAFVDIMNKTASEIGMGSTRYFDSSGLSNASVPLETEYQPGGNYTTAYDTAKLIRKLLSRFPELLKITSIQQKRFTYNDGSYINMKNWNLMLENMPYYYPGLDGLKTGHTIAAGYCFAGTAQQNGHRIISVVFKAATRSKSFQDTKRLLDHGFDNIYDFKVGGAEHPFLLHVLGGTKESVSCYSEESVTIKKGDEDKLLSMIYLYPVEKKIKAPVEAGAKLAYVHIIIPEGYRYAGSKQKREAALEIIAQETVGRKSLRLLLIDAVKNLAAGWFSI